MLGLAPKLRLPVGAAVHAAHLPRPDVNRIIGQSPTFDTPITSKTLIMSTSNCKPYVASSLRTLLEQMIEDITQNTLCLASTVQAVALNLTSKEKVTMTVCGPTSHVSLVMRGIESQNIKVKLVECPEVVPTGRSLREGSHAVAIVGMSGRFPGSENIHQFWDVLQDGKELHQKVRRCRVKQPRSVANMGFHRFQQVDLISMPSMMRVGRSKTPFWQNTDVSLIIPGISMLAFSMCLRERRLKWIQCSVCCS